MNKELIKKAFQLGYKHGLEKKADPPNYSRVNQALRENTLDGRPVYPARGNPLLSAYIAAAQEFSGNDLGAIMDDPGYYGNDPHKALRSSRAAQAALYAGRLAEPGSARYDRLRNNFIRAGEQNFSRWSNDSAYRARGKASPRNRTQPDTTGLEPGDLDGVDPVLSTFFQNSMVKAPTTTRDVLV